MSSQRSLSSSGPKGQDGPGKLIYLKAVEHCEGRRIFCTFVVSVGGDGEHRSHEGVRVPLFHGVRCDGDAGPLPWGWEPLGVRAGQGKDLVGAAASSRLKPAIELDFPVNGDFTVVLVGCSSDAHAAPGHGADRFRLCHDPSCR